MTLAANIIINPIEDEMKDSYLDYAMSVIVSRALPDIRDGLKPVHRRILYSMYKQNLTPDRPFRKSATIIGDVIGKYHPHGDTAIYDALVRLAQDFNMRYPLIAGHGNFGSVDGDPAAAYRYTEARMDKISLELLEDIDKETVDFRPNFDNSQTEPEALPAKLPNFLINGSVGIAVGMATNVPPHNLGEATDALVALIDKPDISPEELIKIVPAPDFPTGGYIIGSQGAKSAYLTGRGSITMRAKTEIEERKGKKSAIIIKEIPYQVNKARLIEQIAEGVRSKRITGVSNIRDESDREGMRVVIELQSHANIQLITNQLIKRSDLQCNFGIIMLALVDGVPRVLTLKECLQLYLKHRKTVVTRRSQYELKKAKERAHILEGLKIALKNIDSVIKTIKASSQVSQAKAALIKKFKLTEIQAQAILDMRLQRLVALEQQKIIAEHKELLEKIRHLELLLKSEKKIFNIIRKELIDLKKKFENPRRTQILPAESTDFEVEDLIPKEDMVITVTRSGYIKRISIASYRAQRRGGRGVTGLTMKQEDVLEHLFVATTHHYLLFFTNKGRVYRLKVHQVPAAGRQAKGTNLVNLLSVDSSERVTAIFPVRDFESKDYLLMTTKKGIINKTSLSGFIHIRKTGIYAIKLDSGNELVDVRLTPGNMDVILISKNGLAIRFNEKDVRPTGRATRGVKGMALRPQDEVVASVQVETGEEELLVVTQKGFGKRTTLDEYRRQSRGGKGVKTLKVTAKNGPIVSANAVKSDDEIMLITQKGTVIRIKIKEVSKLGRATQGVVLMRPEKGDYVNEVALIRKEE